MLEEHYETETVHEAHHPIGYYFAKAKEMELHPAYIYLLNRETKEWYAEQLEEVYAILYDRVMTSTQSSLLKHDMEEWYSFNRDFLGFCDTADMNRDLETLLRKFQLI